MIVQPTLRRHLAELAIVASASGATGAVVVLAANGIADAGDLLGFVGAFVGAVLTVGGAIYASGRAERQTAKELLAANYRTMIGLDDSGAFLQRLNMLQPLEGDGSPAEMAGRLRHELLSIPATGAMLRQPTVLQQIREPEVLKHVMEVGRYLDLVNGEFEDATKLRMQWTGAGHNPSDYVATQIGNDTLMELRLVAQNAALAIERAVGIDRFGPTTGD